jgi:hypothetical protein
MLGFNTRTLSLIAPPPRNPKGGGTSDQWIRLEGTLGLKFPEDFKECVATYGAGAFNNFFGVATPFYSGPTYTPYEDWVSIRLEGLELAKSSNPEEAVLLPVYPQKGGLFPWGYTDNGGTMCWLTERKGSRWPIICLDEACSKDYDRFDISVFEFIEKWLTNQIVVPSLTPPDFFPIQKPSFRPLAE